MYNIAIQAKDDNQDILLQWKGVKLDINSSIVWKQQCYLSFIYEELVQEHMDRYRQIQQYFWSTFLKFVYEVNAVSK